jgi:hypothetical protein
MNPTQKEKILDEITAFVDHPSLSTLLKHFGYNPPDTSHLTQRIAAMKLFSNRYWDFRNGREREEVDTVHFTKNQETTILQVASELSLIDDLKPRKKSYHVCLVLGSWGKNPLIRAQYAQTCGATYSLVCLLGSENKFPRHTAVDTLYKEYAPNAVTEFDLMSAVAEKVYHGTDAETVSFPWHKWQLRQYKKPNESPEIFVLSSPSRDPKRRANTADTYAFVAHLLPADIKDILIVTSSNFAPFQHFDARRMLTVPFGKDVETIGFTTTKTTYHTPQHYLQEINSAINAAHALIEAVENRSA